MGARCGARERCLLDWRCLDTVSNSQRSGRVQPRTLVVARTRCRPPSRATA